MASPVITPNMNLIEPGVGSTLSPTWAQDLNANMGTIDQHDHSNGSGVKVTPAGLNINVDLPLNNNNLTKVNSLLFQGTVIGTPSILSIYSNGTDFFFKDVNGVPIQLTKSGGPNAGTGNIQNLPSTPTGGAGISWINGQSTFQFLADPGTVGANIDSGAVIIRYPGSYPTPSGNYIAIQAPVALASGFSLTLPATLPGSTLPLQVDSSGNITAAQITGAQVVSSVALSGQVSATSRFNAPTIYADNILQVGSFGPVVQLTQGSSSFALGINKEVHAAGRLYPGSSSGDDYSGAGLANFSVNTLQVYNPGTGSSRPIVVSATPSTSGLVIIRGIINANGTTASGEGFTSSRLSTGIYAISLTANLADAPAASATLIDTPGGFNYSVVVPQGTLGTAGCQVHTSVGGNSSNLADCAFSIILIGQRLS